MKPAVRVAPGIIPHYSISEGFVDKRKKLILLIQNTRVKEENYKPNLIDIKSRRAGGEF